MNRKGTTQMLSTLTEHYINPKNDSRIYTAKEVTFNYSSKEDTIRVDYMKFVPVNNSVSGIEKGDFYCYEIKSCMADYESGHGLNFIGDYNYLVMTEELLNELYEKYGDKFKWEYHNIGILVPCGDTLQVHRKAKRIDRKYPLSEMLLMMFRSNQRDIITIKRRINEAKI